MQQVLRTKGRRAVSCGFELPDHQRIEGQFAGTYRAYRPSAWGCILEIIIIGLLAFVVYKFFRLSTGAGKEAVRAYVYLETLNKGISPYEANAVTDAMLSDIGSDMAGRAMDMAKQQYATIHEGKQLSVIGHAYRQGMRPTMPLWYTAIPRLVPPTPQVEVLYGRLRGAVQMTDEDPQADEEMRKDERYVAFYEAYANEVHRLSGKSANDLRVSDFMEHEPLHRAYRDGLDPLVLAAQFCHEQGQTTEKFADYDSYFAAFANELKRFTSDPAELSDWIAKAKADPDRMGYNFQQGIHPRLTALGFYNVTQNTGHRHPNSRHKTYEEYFQSFLAALTPHFKDAAEVERVVGVMKDDRIRSGYENGINPADVAEQYRDFLGQTILSHARR